MSHQIRNVVVGKDGLIRFSGRISRKGLATGWGAGRLAPVEGEFVVDPRVASFAPSGVIISLHQDGGGSVWRITLSESCSADRAALDMLFPDRSRM